MEQQNEQEIELSIIIKTLNEEKNIARCIEAILTSLHDMAVEIIVADSGSSDRTVDVAASYPVTVVQLANPAERCCGIGPQLGFQHSHGRYVLILDADMVLHASFVRCALARMKSDSRCGGIGGQLVECSGTGYEYDLQRVLNSVQKEEVNWLNGSALYRREAIVSVGYLSNRNLHAYEEKELGLRLKYAGWHLYRITEVAVDHYGHAIDTVKLLWRRWRSGYADACGESIRASFGKPYLLDMVSVHKALVVCLVLQIAFVGGWLSLPWHPGPLLLVFVLVLIGVLVQLYRKKSMQNAMHSILHLNVFAIGLAKGLLKPQIDPMLPIHSVICKKVVEGAIRWH
jgi:glycosyltransferase involved in cell wall biosynthesis